MSKFKLVNDTWEIIYKVLGTVQEPYRISMQEMYNQYFTELNLYVYGTNVKHNMFTTVGIVQGLQVTFSGLTFRVDLKNTKLFWKWYELEEC